MNLDQITAQIRSFKSDAHVELSISQIKRFHGAAIRDHHMHQEAAAKLRATCPEMAAINDLHAVGKIGYAMGLEVACAVLGLYDLEIELRAARTSFRPVTDAEVDAAFTRQQAEQADAESASTSERRHGHGWDHDDDRDHLTDDNTDFGDDLDEAARAYTVGADDIDPETLQGAADAAREAAFEDRLLAGGAA
jgi:hypothetical protein